MEPSRRPPARPVLVLLVGTLLAGLLLLPDPAWTQDPAAPEDPAEDEASGETDPSDPAPTDDPAVAAELPGLVPEAGPISWTSVEAPDPPLPGPGLLARGFRAYAARCASCHGLEGRGDGWLASHLDPAPRDLVDERLFLKTTGYGDPPLPADVYRTVTAGIPVSSMPPGDDLPAADRWALAAFVLSVSEEMRWWPPRDVVGIPEVEPGTEEDVAHGREVYEQLSCDSCHAGETQGAHDFDDGTVTLKGGDRPADVLRSLLVGMPGTAMPSYAHQVPGTVSREDLEDLARYVVHRTREGTSSRREAWARFLARRRDELPSPRRTLSYIPRSEGSGPETAPADAPAGQGCLACHHGMESIGEPMEEALRAVAGTRGRACATCHQGQPRARTRSEAHRGMLIDPGNLWATSMGLGCATCHAGPESLTSLHGRELPEATGGRTMAVRSTVADPSGRTGADHAYRMQRSLMATEMGKVSHTLASAGLVEPGDWSHADFTVDDPDGPTPVVEGPYRAWVERAVEEGWLPALEEVRRIPTLEEAREMAGPDAPVERTLLVEYYRKVCAACHLYGEGRGGRDEWRGGGCTACHMVTNRMGTYEGEDPTVPRGRPSHPDRHEIVTFPPSTQCIRCHTSYNLMPHWDLHLDRGMDCVDCHTSVDVHGDGNIYPSKQFQVEVRCEDCHGTPWNEPWELPVGHGTPVTSDEPRGTWEGPEGREHVLSSRGNPWSHVIRGEEGVRLTDRVDGEEREVAVIADRLHETCWAEAGDGPAADDDVARRHFDELACQACHARRTFSCFGCHFTYDRREMGEDLILGARDYDPETRRARESLTPGAFELDPIGSVGSEEPVLRRDLTGRISPFQHACRYIATVVSEDGTSEEHALGRGHESPLAIAAPHEGRPEPRDCASCHDPVPDPDPEAWEGAREGYPYESGPAPLPPPEERPDDGGGGRSPFGE